MHNAMLLLNNKSILEDFVHSVCYLRTVYTRVLAFLDETFTTWIGCRGTTDWPARSPDLTPCDFASWGIVKEAAFSRNPD